MSNFDKKYVVREAEYILEECAYRNRAEKKQLEELNKKCFKLKKINFILKIAIAVVSIILLTIVI